MLILLAETVVFSPHSIALLSFVFFGFFFFPSSSEPLLLALGADWLTNRLIGLGAASGIEMERNKGMTGSV